MSFIIYGKQQQAGADAVPLESWAPSLERSMSKLAGGAMPRYLGEHAIYQAFAVRMMNLEDRTIQTSLLVEGFSADDSPEGTRRLVGRCSLHFVSRDGLGGVSLTEHILAEGQNGHSCLRIESLDDQIALGIIAMDAISVTQPRHH